MKQKPVVIAILFCSAVCLATFAIWIRQTEKREIESAWRFFVSELATARYEDAYDSMSSLYRQSHTLMEFKQSRWCDLSHPWFVIVNNRDVQLVYIRTLAPLTKKAHLLVTTAVLSKPFFLEDGFVATETIMKKESQKWVLDEEPVFVGR